MSTYALPLTRPEQGLDLAEELEWFQAEAPSWEWKWASTFAKSAPHSYVIKGKHLDPITYERAVRVVLTMGTPRKFWSKLNIELHLPHLAIPFGPRNPRILTDGAKFWPMSNRMTVSKALNMAPMQFTYGTQDAPLTLSDHRTTYDAIAADWDDLLDESLNRPYEAKTNHPAQTALWKRIVGDEYVKDLLELGPRTGWALDMRLARPINEAYTAVEPSQAMLNQLVYKNQWVKDVWPITPEEWFTSPHDRPFDTVVSLNGSASYLSPREVRLAAARATRVAVFMHYSDDHPTDFFGPVQLPALAADSREMARHLPGALVEQLGPFQLVTVRK